MHGRDTHSYDDAQDMPKYVDVYRFFQRGEQ